MGKAKLTFDWAAARVANGALWLECSDGETMLVKINQLIMDEAGMGKPGKLPREMRSWIEGAVRRRYFAAMANGKMGRNAPGNIHILTVEAEDFS